MKDKKLLNLHVRTLYSRDFSSLMLSQYKANLTFSFAPYAGKDNRGIDQYDLKMFLSTSVSYVEAAAFFHIAESIVSGKNKPRKFTLARNKATLLFEFKPNQDNQMEAFLVIMKDNRSIPFKFSTAVYETQENGQTVTEIIQTGLIAFAQALQGYLSGIGVDFGIYRDPNEAPDIQQATPTVNNTPYQAPAWKSSPYQPPTANNYQYRPM